MIEIKNLTKIYNDQKVVNNISLTVKKGLIFGFLGPNGAGKTTTIKMIVGLNNPDKGAITIEGKPPSDMPTREKISFMPESPYFYEHLTGLEFLKFCGQLFNGSRKKTEKEYIQLLEKMGIAEAQGHLINTYSKGMKQRLGFAQTLVNNPDYIFLDEPLDGLDPLGRQELKTIVKELRTKGKTVFFNSHILSDVEEICDQIGIISKGTLLYSGPVKEFTNGKTLEEQFVLTIKASEKRS